MDVLLVENRPTICAVWQQRLLARGHQVRAVPDAETAWQVCQTSTFPLIILDWLLPGMDGLTLCRSIRALPWGASCVILVIAGRKQPADLDALLDAGATDFLPRSAATAAITLRLAVLERQALALRRQHAEETPRTGEASLRHLVAAAPVAMSITNAHGVLEQVNAAYCALFGYTAAELIGSPVSMFLPPEQRDHALLSYQRRAVDMREGPYEWDVITKAGDRRTVLSTAVKVPDAGNSSGCVTFVLDITERKHAEQQLLQRAIQDALTGLPNRLLFHDAVTQLVVTAHLPADAFAVLFLDLDGFKAVNDTLGHHYGDGVLQAVATRLRGCVRGRDLVARFGGDEFTILLRDIHSREHAARVAQKLLDCLAQPLDLSGPASSITASIGIGLYPTDGMSAQALLAAADTAMYAAKRLGKWRYVFADTTTTSVSPRHD